MSVATATKKRDLTVQYLKDMTVTHLSEQQRAVPLDSLLLYLATLSRDDALISRTLADLQDHRVVALGIDRHVRLCQP